MGLFSNFFGKESYPTNNNEEKIEVSSNEVKSEEVPKSQEMETAVDLEQNRARIIARLKELDDKDDPDSNAERADLQRQLDMIDGMSEPKDY